MSVNIVHHYLCPPALSAWTVESISQESILAKINPLLCCPSPRDITEVYDALKETGYDRLYAKYYPELKAYQLLREYFLDHEEYTHLVICPDDLVIEKKHIDALIEDLQKSDYPVLSGVCNVDQGDNKDLLNITYNLPHPKRTVPKKNVIGWRHYHWVHKNTVFNTSLIDVLFSGFACMFLRRDVVSKYKFADDALQNGTPSLMTGAIDVMFANVCAITGIRQTVDQTVRMDHLKGKERFFDITLGDGELRLYHKGTDMYELEQSEAKGKRRTWNITKGDEVVEGIVDERTD